MRSIGSALRRRAGGAQGQHSADVRLVVMVLRGPSDPEAPFTDPACDQHEVIARAPIEPDPIHPSPTPRDLPLEHDTGPGMARRHLAADSEEVALFDGVLT